MEQLLDEVAAGPLALVLNPSWSTGVPEQFQALVDTFLVVYSFLPVAIQVGWCCWLVLQAGAAGWCCRLCCRLCSWLAVCLAPCSRCRLCCMHAFAPE